MIIIIHPGSLNLRMGRASDLNPVRITNAIARRRKACGKIHRDTVLPPSVSKPGKELVQELEDCRLQISHTLQSCLQSDGRRRYPTPPQQIAAFNRRATPEVIDTSVQPYLSIKEDTVIGDNVLELDPNGEFNVHFPIRRGDFNLHPGVGGSMTSVLADLQEIWEYVLRYHMSVDLK